MKKTLLSIGTVGTLLLTLSPVYAESNISGTPRVKYQELRQETRDQMREKLSEIKDEKKKVLATRLANRVCEMQSKRVTQWEKRLSNIDLVINKVVEKAAKLKTDGKDVSTVDAAVVAAKDASTKAKTAVSEFKQKDCQIKVTDETTLKSVFYSSISTWEKSSKSVSELIQSARKGATAAVVALAKITQENVTQIIK